MYFFLLILTLLACETCNFRKAQTMPEDLPKINMKLRNLPRMPSMYELQSKAKMYKKMKTHPHWDDYIG